MSGIKIVKYDAKNSLQILGHEVDGVSKGGEQFRFFLEWGKTEEVMLILTGVKGLC